MEQEVGGSNPPDCTIRQAREGGWQPRYAAIPNVVSLSDPKLKIMAVVHLLDLILAFFGDLIGNLFPNRVGKWLAAFIFITVVVLIVAISQV